MGLLKRINNFRRDLMEGLTKNVGHSSQKQNLKPIDPNDVKRVLLSRPNHRLGNQILMTPLLEEISESFPNCKIDLFTKGNLAPVLFKNFDKIDRYIRLPKKHFHHLLHYAGGWLSLKKRHYDLVVNVDKSSSSGRLSTQFARADYKFFGDEGKNLSGHADSVHLAKSPVYGLRHFLSQRGIPENQSPVPPLSLHLSPEEMEKGREILGEYVDTNKKTICLYTYATDDKCYPKSWWKEFYNNLKSRFEGYNIFEVLPVENVSQIDFEAPAYYSKDIREICSVIANCEVFVGADCGVMHLATASGTPTIGLFSRKNMKKYQPYGGLNTAFYTKETGMEEIAEHVEKIVKN